MAESCDWALGEVAANKGLTERVGDERDDVLGTPGKKLATVC
jgi:hypothetical protein